MFIFSCNILKLNLYFALIELTILKLVHCLNRLDLCNTNNLRQLGTTKLAYIQSYSLIQTLRLITFVP